MELLAGSANVGVIGAAHTNSNRIPAGWRRRSEICHRLTAATTTRADVERRSCHDSKRPRAASAQAACSVGCQHFVCLACTRSPATPAPIVGRRRLHKKVKPMMVAPVQADFGGDSSRKLGGGGAASIPASSLQASAFSKAVLGLLVVLSVYSGACLRRLRLYGRVPAAGRALPPRLPERRERGRRPGPRQPLRGVGARAHGDRGQKRASSTRRGGSERRALRARARPMTARRRGREPARAPQSGSSPRSAASHVHRAHGHRVGVSWSRS